MIYIYALIDPRTRGIRYVGQSTDPERRYAEHLQRAEGTPKGVWIRELRALNLEPDLIVLGDAEDQQQANYLEIWWMLVGWRQGWKLTNGTNPSEWRVAEDFKLLFADELVQASAEGIKGFVLTAKRQMLHWTIFAFTTPFVLAGVLYMGVKALESTGPQEAFIALCLMAFWFLILPILYFFGQVRVLSESYLDAYDTLVSRVAYIGLAVASIWFGLLCTTQLLVKWGLVTI